MKPKIVRMFKRGDLTKDGILKDIISGIIVAVIALPLSVALGISSGVTPEKGLITAIIAGFFISLLGGSRVQIGGPTGAFVVIVYGIVQNYGISGLIIATIMAGIIMIILGLLKLGSVIKFVPHPITVGFTSGIAITLLSTQLKDFFGLKIDKVPAEFIPKLTSYIDNMNSFNGTTFAIGILSLGIMILWPKVNKKIPASLVALVISTVLVTMFNIPVDTIGSRFANISSSIPMPSIPNVDFNTIQKLLPAAFTIALLASIESLLSAVVADGMIGGKHDANMELIAQGVANIASGLFGGIPATGAIARTAANVKNGGRSPIAGIVHAITLLLIMVIFMPLAKLIPMSTLAAILIMVSYNMGEWKTLYSLLKAPKSDVAILLLTFVLTIVFDLVVAIEIGMVLAMFLFMKRVSDNTKIVTLDYNDEDDDDIQESIEDNVLIYEIHGPFFFGVTNKLMDVMQEINSSYDVLILDLKNSHTIDCSAMETLERLYERCEKNNIRLLLANVDVQPRKVLKKMGFTNLIGEKSVFKNRKAALNSLAG